MASSDASGSGAMRRHGVHIALVLGAVAGMAALAWNFFSPTAVPPADAMAGKSAATIATIATAGTSGQAAASAAASAPSVRPANAAKSPTAAAVAARRSASPGAVPTGPKAACADLNLFARAVCISRECQTPRWREHPQCAQARAIEEQRQRHKDQF
jgi:hypothetical protein